MKPRRWLRCGALIAGVLFGVSSNASADTGLLFCSGTTIRASIDPWGQEFPRSSDTVSISADGRYVAFEYNGDSQVSAEPYLDEPHPGATLTDLIAVRDVLAGTTRVVHVDWFDGHNDAGISLYADLAPDGSSVVYTSSDPTIVPGDTNDAWDVFVYSMATGQTQRVSVSSSDAQGNRWSYGGSLSADGRYVVFSSDATNLVDGDTNQASDTFLRDLGAGTTTRVSLANGDQEGNGFSWGDSISTDGRYVAFVSYASNLVAGDTSKYSDAFVRDLIAGTTERASVSWDGTQPDGSSWGSSISGDGRYVAFTSRASNLVIGDTNEVWRAVRPVADAFVHDRVTGETKRISVGPAGMEAVAGYSEATDISHDGRYVAFDSNAPNLVPGDTNLTWDAFVYDQQAATTTRVSLNSSGEEGNNASASPVISADGMTVAFESYASNLVDDDHNSSKDIFVRTLRC